MGKLFRLFLSITLLILLFLAIYWWSPRPSEDPIPSKNHYFDIYPGESFATITYHLGESRGFFLPKLFQIYGRLFGLDKLIQPGTYELPSTLSPHDILKKITSGDSVNITVTFPEGWSVIQILEKLRSEYPHFSEKIWLNAIEQSQMFLQTEISKIQKIYNLPMNLPPPEVITLEGYLYPGQYQFRPTADPKSLLTTMIKRFFTELQKPTLLEAQKLGFNLHSLVTLASLIEKETGAPEERAHISQVFHTRLKKNMRLQTDPTVIYGLGKNYDGKIHKKDLQTPTPYNTYMIPALPPGPIASPGKDSINAAAFPTATDDLFFVSMGQGKHYFSKDLKDHNKAVQKYILKKP
jgi:UPF0755 protein